MKRKTFLLGLLAPVPVAAWASGSLKQPGPGFRVAAGEGRYHGHIKLKGVNANIMDVKVSGKDTGGSLAIFEQTSLSPGRGTPLHVHPNQDEVFYVLEGNFLFQVGQEKHRLQTGDSIFLPRKVPHAWTQVSTKGKMTVTFQPAGLLEEFFLVMAALSKEPNAQEIAKIFARHDMQVVGPPLKAG